LRQDGFPVGTLVVLFDGKWIEVRFKGVALNLGVSNIVAHLAAMQSK
jgi:hypothetical protein